MSPALEKMLKEYRLTNAVQKVLWALEPLESGEQRVLALKEALGQLREFNKKARPK